MRNIIFFVGGLCFLSLIFSCSNEKKQELESVCQKNARLDIRLETAKFKADSIKNSVLNSLIKKVNDTLQNELNKTSKVEPADFHKIVNYIIKYGVFRDKKSYVYESEQVFDPLKGSDESFVLFQNNNDEYVISYTVDARNLLANQHFALTFFITKDSLLPVFNSDIKDRTNMNWIYHKLLRRIKFKD